MLSRFFYTLSDIGIYRILLRLKYESLYLIEKLYPFQINKFFYKKKIKFKIYKFRHNLVFKDIEKSCPKKINHLEIESINQKIIIFNNKINWFPVNKSRLYIFNLHYFEWIKEYINKSLKEDLLVPEIRGLKNI